MNVRERVESVMDKMIQDYCKTEEMIAFREKYNLDKELFPMMMKAIWFENMRNDINRGAGGFGSTGK